ncbi:RNA polymerase sigma factor [Streptosporangium subroseum]|nr:RNA polymerase sigma factor [Streptosporangium subroseum]
MTAEMREQVNDAELVDRFQRDPELFTAVYDRYFRDIYLYATGRLDVQAGEDIAAETFCVAFRDRERFNPERGSLRPWLFGIATNLMARHRRKEARHYRALARVRVEPVPDSHENRVISSVTAERMKPQLVKALAALNQGERDVVMLVSLGQLSHQEVAEALGVSYGTVGSRLSRARKKLHNAIDQEAFHG